MALLGSLQDWFTWILLSRFIKAQYGPCQEPQDGKPGTEHCLPTDIRLDSLGLCTCQVSNEQCVSTKHKRMKHQSLLLSVFREGLT